MGVNYGLDKVRFPSPVRSAPGSASLGKVGDVEEVPGNGVQMLRRLHRRGRGRHQARLRRPGDLPPVRLSADGRKGEPSCATPGSVRGRPAGSGRHHGRTALVYGEQTDHVRRASRPCHRARARPCVSAVCGRGDRVAYLGPNHPAFVETMFATHALGAIFVPLNFRLAAPEVAYMLDDSGATLLVHAPENAEVVAGLDGFDGRRVALGSPGPVEDVYADLVADAPGSDADELDVPVAPTDDPALILYTSGTTGRSKGAVLTHENLFYQRGQPDRRRRRRGRRGHARRARRCSTSRRSTRRLLPTFLKGGTCVIMSTWDVDACFDLIAEHRVTWMFGVTAMFAGLAQSPRWADADLSSVRTLMSGGAPVPRGADPRVPGARADVLPGLRDDGDGTRRDVPAPRAVDRKSGHGRHALLLRRCPGASTRTWSTSLPGVPGEVLVRGPERDARATGTVRTRPRPRSPTAGCAPATSRSSTTRAT